MAISRLEKSILEAQGIASKKAAKMVVPTEYEVEKYSSAVYLEEEQKILKIKPHEWVEHAFRILNKDTNKFENFSFKDREYWIPIYDSPSKKILCKTGRQVNKSTFLGNRALSYCCLQLGFHVLYVSPSQTQTREFAQTRLKSPIRESSVLKLFENSKLVDNTMSKEFVTTSKISLRYSYLNADRCRGLAGVDCLLIDEFQDIIQDNVPVIEQTTFAASKKYRLFLYAGTPKSLDNPIEDAWANYSTMNEWAIPCYRHSYFSANGKTNIHWNVVIDDKNIGLKGLQCEKCCELINPRDPKCHWVSMNPEIHRKVPMPFDGYHLSQIISPDCEWKKILQDREAYSKPKFFNEVLGISTDSADRPLCRQDLIDNCDEKLSMNPDFLEKLKDQITDGRNIYAGLDWSGGTDKSLTVLVIATYIDNLFVPFFWKKYTGSEADLDIQIKDIISKLREWRVSLVGADYGGGMWPNDKLQREFGAARVFKYQYAQGKRKLKWEPDLGRFLAHRSEVLSSLFAAIKRRNVFRFPKWNEFEEFGQDFLGITANYNEITRMTQYQHVLSQVDDSVHALNLCFLVSMIDRPRRDCLIADSLSGYSEDLTGI